MPAPAPAAAQCVEGKRERLGATNAVAPSRLRVGRRGGGGTCREGEGEGRRAATHGPWPARKGVLVSQW